MDLGKSIYVGKFLKGKQVVDVSSDAKFVNFYFEDGSYEVAPIIDGVVKVEFDEVVEDDVEDENVPDPTSEIIPEPTEEELGFYKTLQPIPYTNEEGEEIGKTEIGSIQEVPVALGDFWVAEGWAEKTEKPEESLLNKIISGVISNK